MYKREIKALSSHMEDAISKTINRLEEAAGNDKRSADQKMGDTKPDNVEDDQITPNKEDGSQKKAPARKADAKPDLQEKYKVGDTVKPQRGPHKDHPHEIIHAFGDGTYNIRPIGLSPKQTKYRLGAAKASESDLTKLQEEVELDEALIQSYLLNELRKDKKLDPIGKEDEDIDNDGDVDDSDSYLRHRRDVITKAVKKQKEKSKELKEDREKIEKQVVESVDLKERWEVPAGKHAIGSASYDDKEIVTVDKETAAKLQAYFKKNNDGKAWGELFQGKGKGKNSVEDQKSFDAYVQRLLGEEVELDEAKSYEYKDGKVHISKADFQKVSKDYKNSTKGKERMMVMDPKTGSTVSAPVVFTERKENYTVYHKTFSSAVQHAVEMAKKRGYEVDPEDYDQKVALGPRKPSVGKTNSYSLDLMKNGKPVKQKLIMQVYYDEGRYELNMYIS